MTSIGERLRAGGPPLAGFANLIPSPVATQALAAAGADVVMIDQEHGPIGDRGSDVQRLLDDDEGHPPSAQLVDDLDEPFDHHRGEPETDCFDFGQFRHAFANPL